jgi:hypothetical protein
MIAYVVVDIMIKITMIFVSGVMILSKIVKNAFIM